MNRKQITRLLVDLRKDEGLRTEPYQCTEGHWTIGVGHKILPHEEFTELSRVAAMQLLELDIQKAIEGCERIYDDFDAWPEPVQEILVNMCFQLGETGLLGFRNMNAALRRRAWREAAKHGRDSKWQKQTPNRCERLMVRLEKVDG